MATYTKETALYDTGAIAGDIAEAGTTATNYISTVSNDGIFVHQTDSGKDGTTPTASTAYGVHISDDIDIIQGGVSIASYGSSTRIGDEDNNHIVVTDTVTEFYTDDSTKIGEIGTFGSTGLQIVASDTATMYGANGVAIRAGSNGHVTISGDVELEDKILSFYRIIEVSKTLPNGCNANSYISAGNISMSVPTGYKAVGIVGHSSNYFRVQPTTNYIVNNTTLYAGFANWSATNVTASVTVVFYVLCLKSS